MINRKLAKVLSFQYKILALIFIILAGGLVLLPKYEKQEGISAEEFLNKAISSERYISTDQLAHKIINQDPSFLLIDVRDEESYNTFSLPNAINIPIDKIFEDDSNSYLYQDEYDIILFSNDHFYADQAWLLCNRLDYKNLYVLKGGINQWYNTIINPKKPTENMAAEDFELYTFRKASSMYFGVAYPEQVIEKKIVKKNVKKPAKKIITVKKKKKLPAEGGC